MQERIERVETLSLVERLARYPIAGGDGTDDPPAGDPPPADPPVDPPADPPADPPPPPDPAEEVARLREANARLSGENEALRRPAAEPPPKQDRSLEELSVDELKHAGDDIEQKIEAGEITAARGARLLGQIEAIRLDKSRTQREVSARPVRKADESLAAYIKQYPDLAVRGSDLLGKVSEEIAAVVEQFGFAHDDPRAQVLAVERVVGHSPGGGSVNGREFLRRKTPVGGPGGGGPSSDPPRPATPDPVKEVERLYPDQIAFWNRMNSSAEERKAEAPLVLMRRARRSVARTA